MLDLVHRILCSSDFIKIGVDVFARIHCSMNSTVKLTVANKSFRISLGKRSAISYRHLIGRRNHGE